MNKVTADAVKEIDKIPLYKTHTDKRLIFESGIIFGLCNPELLTAQGLYTKEQVIDFSVNNLGNGVAESRKALSDFDAYLQHYNNPSPPKTEL